MANIESIEKFSQLCDVEEIDELTPRGGIFIPDLQEFVFRMYSDPYSELPPKIPPFIYGTIDALVRIISKRNSGIGYIKNVDKLIDGQKLRLSFFTSKAIDNILTTRSVADLVQTFVGRQVNTSLTDPGLNTVKEALRIITE